MKTAVSVLIVVAALVCSAVDVYAMGGGGRGKKGTSGAETYDTTRYASVPEPTTLYAVGAGLALLGGAGWYIRRRK